MFNMITESLFKDQTKLAWVSGLRPTAITNAVVAINAGSEAMCQFQRPGLIYTTESQGSCYTGISSRQDTE